MHSENRWPTACLGLLLVFGACRSVEEPAEVASARTTATDAIPGCAELIQQQVTDLLEAFDDAGNAGAAEGEAYRRLVDLSPEDCPEWDGAAAADALNDEALRRLEALEASGEELGPDMYAAITGRAIVAAALRPAPSFDVPDGFPDEFPVVEGAHLVHSTRDGDEVTATWRVPGAGFEEVRVFYESALQTMVMGRWSARRSAGSVTQGAGAVVLGENLYEVTGFGREGTVVIALAEGDEQVTVEATLAPEA